MPASLSRERVYFTCGQPLFHGQNDTALHYLFPARNNTSDYGIFSKKLVVALLFHDYNR